MTGVTAGQLAFLDQSIAALRELGGDRAALMRLRDLIGAVIPSSHAWRIEPDPEAMLESRRFVARPGPRPAVDANAAAKIVVLPPVDGSSCLRGMR